MLSGILVGASIASLWWTLAVLITWKKLTRLNRHRARLYAVEEYAAQRTAAQAAEDQYVYDEAIAQARAHLDSEDLFVRGLAAYQLERLGRISPAEYARRRWNVS
jgi:hypothetical protein